jgi:glycosyltransferase involved in cell wall biosynthesis
VPVRYFQELGMEYKIKNLIKSILRKKSTKEHAHSALREDCFNANLEKKTPNKKLKVLITDTAPLYPPQWGGPKRIWHLFSNFPEEDFEFTYAGVTFEGSPESKCMHKRIRDNFEEILTVFPPHYALWHMLEKIVLKNTHLDLFPYLAMNTDGQFKRLLDSRQTDIIVCSHPWAWPCVPKIANQFLIYDAHNCEYFLMAGILKGRLLKNFVLRQVKRIEGGLCRRSDLILACSAKEKEDLIELYKIDPGKVIIVTNGTEVKEATSAVKRENSRKALGLAQSEKVVVFVGMYYKPNIDAANFIIRKIAPDLPDFKFLLVGAISEAFVSAKLPANIKFLAKVADVQLETVLRAADIAINPMFDGSGINIKILDYMSYGLPIVTTECGARGIETYTREAMIVAPANDFPDAIKKLSSNRQLEERLSEAGRSLASEYYDWRTISHRLREAMLERLKFNHGQ